MKMKKWLVTLLAVAMAAAMLPSMAFASSLPEEGEESSVITEEDVGEKEDEEETKETTEEEQNVQAEQPEEVRQGRVMRLAKTAGIAEISGTTYNSLSEAIEAAGAETVTITLLANTAEDVVIPTGANITLSINEGVTLTNLAGNTITNNGTLTVTGSGTVTNTINGKTTLLNEGTANLQGGNFIRTDTEGNSYYTVVNHNSMTVDGASISNSNTLASCLENGWYTAEEVSGTANLMIRSGSITGGMHTVKNDEGSVLEITGGTISGNTLYTIINYNKATIFGGTITNENTKTGTAAVSNGYYESPNTYPGEMTIQGGTFNGCYAISNASELKIEAGKFQGTSSGIATMEKSNTLISGGDFTGAKYYGLTADGDVTITGGTFTGGSASSAYAVRAKSKSKITIEDGKFTAGDKGNYTLYQGSEGAFIDVNGGTFAGGIKGNIYANSKTPGVTVYGGTYTSDVSNYVAPGNKVVEKDGQYILAAAEVNEVGYATLQEAIEAAKDSGAVVTLLKNTDENVTVSKETKITLDLNGKVLNGGTVRGKAALTNYGEVKIIDSSEDQTGTIQRADTTKQGCYYTILNEGTMEIAGGNVYNHAGGDEVSPWSGSSLICNGAKNPASLTISGGKISQDYFIAVKNDECGTLEITGGTIESKTQSVQNWKEATISGGTLTGDILTCAYLEFAGETTIKGDVQITGNVSVYWYNENSSYPATAVPSVIIEGGTVNGTLAKMSTVNGSTAQIEKNEDGKGKIQIYGGTFSEEIPSVFCAEGFEPVQNADGSYTVHNHTYGTEWKYDADGHWRECACGDKTDNEAHTLAWITDKQATATEKGSKHQECSVCGYKGEAVEIPAISTTPETPTDQEKPGISEKPETSAPSASGTEGKKSDGSLVAKTGDSSNMRLWFLVMAVSGLGGGAVLLYGRKRKADR